LRKQIAEDNDLSRRTQPSTTSSSRMIPFSSMIQTPTTAIPTPFPRNTGTANADDDIANKASSKVTTTPNNIDAGGVNSDAKRMNNRNYIINEVLKLQWMRPDPTSIFSSQSNVAAAEIVAKTSMEDDKEGAMVNDLSYDFFPNKDNNYEIDNNEYDEPSKQSKVRKRRQYNQHHSILRLDTSPVIIEDICAVGGLYDIDPPLLSSYLPCNGDINNIGIHYGHDDPERAFISKNHDWHHRRSDVVSTNDENSNNDMSKNDGKDKNGQSNSKSKNNESMSDEIEIDDLLILSIRRSIGSIIESIAAARKSNDIKRMIIAASSIIPSNRKIIWQKVIPIPYVFDCMKRGLFPYLSRDDDGFHANKKGSNHCFINEREDDINETIKLNRMTTDRSIHVLLVLCETFPSYEMGIYVLSKLFPTLLNSMSSSFSGKSFSKNMIECHHHEHEKQQQKQQQLKSNRQQRDIILQQFAQCLVFDCKLGAEIPSKSKMNQLLEKMIITTTTMMHNDNDNDNDNDRYNTGKKKLNIDEKINNSNSKNNKFSIVKSNNNINMVLSRKLASYIAESYYEYHLKRRNPKKLRNLSLKKSDTTLNR